MFWGNDLMNHFAKTLGLVALGVFLTGILVGAAVIAVFWMVQ